MTTTGDNQSRFELGLWATRWAGRGAVTILIEFSEEDRDSVTIMSEITYGGDRPELLRFLDVRGRTVLDVGCGAGGLAPHLKRAGAERVVGVELVDAQAAVAAEVCDAVIAAPIEKVLSDGLLGEERFGMVILADVLEHLVDPWAALRTLAAEHLASDGLMFVSVPNVASLDVIAQLGRRGDWRYDESGLFDRTHLRWFGAGTLRTLLEQAGLEPVTWGGRLKIGVGRFSKDRLSDDVSRVPKFSIYQFHVLARAVTGGS